MNGSRGAAGSAQPESNRRSPSEVAEDLEALVLTTLEELVERYLHDWRVPAFFAGHRVEPDVGADIAFTLAHLHDAGTREIAGTQLTDALGIVLRDIDGARTHTFFSYRVAETLARFGPFGHNTLIDRWPAERRDDLAAAVDSTDWVELLDEYLPRNYAAVLARCELARRSLGLPTDEGVFDDLVARTVAMLGRDPQRRLDDSTHGVGRVDIYTVDVWLFTEPLAPYLGGLWADGVASAVSLVERVGTSRGAAVPWGRSTGALACALTIELASLVLSERTAHPEWTADPGLWRRRLALAATEVGDWFDGGLTTAHRNRDTYGYRGPFRRLQMTVDLLGKLAWAAQRLRLADAPDPDTAHRAPGSTTPGGELIPLIADPPASAWTWHPAGEPDGPVVVPFVGATRSDYLAAPRRPGLYEVPVDSAIACWVPAVASRDRLFAPAGVPDALRAGETGLEARWERLAVLGELDPPAVPDHLRGRAQLTYRVEGRCVEVSTRVELRVGPPATRPGTVTTDAVTVTVPEAEARPLRVEALDGESPGQAMRIDTSGIAQWRSFWGELPTVHQMELAENEPGTHGLTYRVTPSVRVASTAHGHHYDRSLYGPLEDQRRAFSYPSPLGPLGDASVSLGDIDVFHLHWPEWMAFDDLAEHRRIADTLAAHGTPVIWTAHNLTPHEKRPEVYDPIYTLWAQRADAVVHHSRDGESRMRARYDFAGHTRHVVIPHGHFGGLYPTARTPRDEAADELGLPPVAIRIGILGAPRSERDVAGFLTALAASTNRSLQVCCWSLGPHDEPPADERIAVAEDYRMVDATTYGLRLAACDVIALPYGDGGEMLATGVAADVIGCEKAALVSPWPYLDEVLGGARIPMGSTVESMTNALDALDTDTVARASLAAAALRPASAWDHSATLTLELFEDVLAARNKWVRGALAAAAPRRVDPGARSGTVEQRLEAFGDAEEDRQV